ncbi:hypothetical protein GCM10010469_19710 [Streptomyces labedae]|uniref:Uncharacterized protein n=1 Tax=Streptomyces labedae TaxID=285569 RepID=A0ABP6QW00_9ACTN
MRRHTPTRLPTRSIRRGAVGHGATKGRTHDTPHPGTASDARASARPRPDTLRIRRGAERHRATKGRNARHPAPRHRIRRTILAPAAP